MDDLRKKVKGERSFLEKIGKIIPGYSGYKERDMRREADKMLRMYMVQQIDTSMGAVKDLIGEMTQAMKIKLLDLADRPLKKMEKLRDRIKFADAGYTGWFEAIKMTPEVLDKIYEFDDALLTAVQGFGPKIQEARAAVSDDDKLKAALAELYSLVDAADINFNERDNMLMNK